jgi:SAM-dependent methyltransferase
VRRIAQPVRWGTLRRLDPVSAVWGSERGTVVDRYYIDRFFERHGSLIRGRVLEVRDSGYTRRFGQQVTSMDIVDIDPRNDEASIVADLADEGSLPSGAFDCAVVPQTLLFVRDPFAAVANLWESLAPGGTLLVSTPAISRLDPAATDVDRWHLAPAGLAEVIARGCPGADVEIEAHGNPVVAIAFLQGIATEELRSAELEARHPLFPIVVTAVARKPA